MWGNRLGWIISAAITVVTFVLYAILLIGPSVTEPTELTRKAGALDVLSLPGNPKSLLPSGSASDATDLYQQAINAYKSDPTAFENYALTGKLNTPQFKAVSPAMDLLISAVGATKSGVFAKKPAEVVMYNPDQSFALKPIEQLGRVAIRIGLQSNAAKKPDDAKKYLLAAFSLGYAMCSERLVYHELRIGQDLMRSAAINLGTIDKQHGAEFKSIDAQYKAFTEGLEKFRFMFNPSDDRAIAKNAGDVFNLAQNSQERMYRIEAIMMLGHFRYNAAQPGDQRGADAVLLKMAADTSLDPAVLAAVKVAQSLTALQHGNSQQMP